MPAGPGKYDDLATLVREKAEARAVILMVIDGNKGSGFSVQSEGRAFDGIVSVLREVADQIEASERIPHPPTR